jgi:hypothetical protein
MGVIKKYFLNPKVLAVLEMSWMSRFVTEVVISDPSLDLMGP